MGAAALMSGYTGYFCQFCSLNAAETHSLTSVRAGKLVAVVETDSTAEQESVGELSKEEELS